MITFNRKYNRLFLKPVRQAINKFEMLSENDTIAIGLSGGKDSIFLLYAFKLLQLTAYKKLRIIGIHIDLGLGIDLSHLEEFCRTNDLDFHIEKTNIGEVVFEDRKEKNPCSLCSSLRRGALSRVAKSLGATKIALGHNSEDAVETLFMNVLMVGKLGSFHPHIAVPGELEVIRPLVYISERTIMKVVAEEKLPVIKSPCPVDKKTTREDMKRLLSSLEEKYPDAQKKILTALSNVYVNNIWGKK